MLGSTHKYPPIAAAVSALSARQAYLDGELCGVFPDGITSFGMIQAASDASNAAGLVFFIFDLLHLDGDDVSDLPLIERKARLAELLANVAPPLHYSDYHRGQGPAFHERACALELEGIVSKHADAAYAPGNRGLWLKVKCLYREEFVVVGWTDPEGRRGIVRLWMLDGKPAAEPFRGHDEAVLSVAFSPDGTRIVSGQDGIVLLWDIAAATVSTLYFCGADLGLGFVDMRFFWIGCSDRISIQSASFKPRGDLFLNKEGLFTSVYSEGVNVPNDRLQDPFHAVASGGYVIWQRRAVPDISVERVRQVL